MCVVPYLVPEPLNNGVIYLYVLLEECDARDVVEQRRFPNWVLPSVPIQLQISVPFVSSPSPDVLRRPPSLHCVSHLVRTASGCLSVAGQADKAGRHERRSRVP